MEPETNQSSGLYATPVATEFGTHAAAAPDINQASLASEGALQEGAHASHMNEKVVTTQEEATALAAARAKLQQEVQHAVANGIPLSELPPNSSGLDVEGTYRDVAGQNGTSPEKIQREADARRAEEAAMLQSMLGAAAGVAAFEAVVPAHKTELESPFVLTDEQRRNQPVTTEQALAMLGDIPKTQGLPAPQRSQNIGRG